MSNASRILIAVGLLLVTAAGAYLALRDGRVPAPRLFVSNYKDDTVSVVDLELEREIKVIPAGPSPYGITLCRPATGPPLVVVASSTGNDVRFIDAVSAEVVGRVTVPKGPEFVVCSADGTRLYVTSPYAKSVTIVDVAARAPLGEAIGFPHKPGPLALSADGTRLFVTLRDVDGLVQAVDTTTRAVVASAPVGKYPTDVAVSPDGSRLLVPSFDDSTVAVIDAASFKELGRYPASTGSGILAHPSRPLAYTAGGMENTVTVLDYQAGKEVAAIEIGDWPTFSAISTDGRFLYVVNEESDNVVKVDTESNEAVLRIAVGNEPSDAVFVDFPS